MLDDAEKRRGLDEDGDANVDVDSVCFAEGQVKERRDQEKVWGDRHYRGEGSKIEMLWTRSEER